uniref:Uncharacterized protein n=1 Tax=Oryza nivara TaxID=4536 RepID=A0A0E0J6C9_ORYNI
MGAACGSAGPAHRHAGALPRSPGPRDRHGTASPACGTGWFVLAPVQPFRGLGIFLQINHSQEEERLLRGLRRDPGELAPSLESGPSIHIQTGGLRRGSGAVTSSTTATLELEKKSGIARALQGRTSEKELLSLSLVPILFGLGNYKKLIRKGKQLILHGLNEESEAVRLIKRRLLYLGPETIEEGSLLVLKVSPHSVSKEDHFESHTTVGNFFLARRQSRSQSPTTC